MGPGALAAALQAGLVDEVIIHQVPVLLGGGVSFFGDMTGKVQLSDSAWSPLRGHPSQLRSCQVTGL